MRYLKKSQSALARWASTAEARAKAKRLRVDLALLRRAVRHIRATIKRRAKERVRCLAIYHAKGDTKRQLRSLPIALRRVLRNQAARQRVARTALQRAAERVVRRYHQPAVNKLRRRLRRYFEKSFWCGSKSRRMVELLGCSVETAKRHIEQQFKPGMSWGNHGFRTWHIDHIKPLASFDLTDPAQQKLAFHYTNLQPLWAKENLTKQDKFYGTQT